LVEVMMASLILVAGFIGMIQAVTIGSEMLATARRQTIAAQILNHEVEKLRFYSWSQIQGLGNSSASTYTSDLAAINTAIAASGVTFTLARAVADPTTDLREVAFTVTWTVKVSGVATPRTYTRSTSAWFGKYGLNLTYQRS
jgi:Tfp pilus assembly protein PilV